MHDYMHAKVTVADDVVFTGSFNLSHSGEQNAEDMLEIHDAELAERLASYVDTVRARYPRIDAATLAPSEPPGTLRRPDAVVRRGSDAEGVTGAREGAQER